jgi:hypothetical protein
MLIDRMKDVEQKAGLASPPPAPPPLTEVHKQVAEQLVERSRHQVLQEIAEGKTADLCLRRRPRFSCRVARRTLTSGRSQIRT